ncbi:MAG TPA: lysozyme inhibitor LprI family protein [Candidatus Binatia bacterium]|nr:lysozyme inhibitor LprI family protein [Candidatus Binatia bacterium]
MFRAAIVLALAVLTCAPGHADPFESYNPDFVGDCVAAAGADESVLRACLGAGATPCIAAEGSSTMSYVLCWDREATTWREMIERAANDTTTRHGYRDPQRLAAANTAWEAWAEAECEYWAWEEGGGVGEQVDRARCQARVNAERAITLMVAAAER